VKDNSRAGGLAGATLGTGIVSRVRVSGTIRGNGAIGGLSSAGGSFVDCSSSVRIEANQPSTIAGLVAQVEGGSIEASFATGSVTATGKGSYVGGLVAVNAGQIQDSYSTGAVTGGAHSFVGGLVGANGDGHHQIPGTIETSYSTGAVSGRNRSKVGGFAGIAYHSRRGGFIRQSYWDTTTSGTDRGVGKGNPRGVSGLTSQQLQSGLPSGFDPTVWAENPKINDGLPYLIANPPPQ